ncbi:MAG: hypothetical protein COV59_02525 [Candidatus Magasanikbacteria bacterium CG11_big_fil_rev_8_21_14_0_20_39_34]|uniref:Uncharacterized protein n=1 Tax=Candidatus Magasanikbacteria bacterium CG11_big_fil_rev_8_21_14_0_20_39_34 TaxID=1974653 RepID=A0A2H0N565_9BACT|nr:MAG: hypothetical protein COV59_02525 [Candidatus Magasanikbacteria bacterium CG11_big_fil_rev_8_21_14_0_20_39_34]
MKHEECNFFRCSNRVGIFLVALYILCFAWYFIHPVNQSVHIQMLEMSYFGFSGMNFVSFLLGAIQTYIWGYVGVGLWSLLGCCHTKGTCKK